MAYSRHYSRLFITLKQERPDFCLDFRPAMGRCIVEIRNNKGKLSVYAQGLKPRMLYKIFIVKCESGNSLGVPVGLIPIDDNGKGEVKWNFEPDNVGESKCKIEEFNVVALVVQEHNEIIAPLVGYTENVVLWKNNFKSFNRDEVNNKSEEKNNIREKTVNNINDNKKDIDNKINNKEIKEETIKEEAIKETKNINNDEVKEEQENINSKEVIEEFKNNEIYEEKEQKNINSQASIQKILEEDKEIIDINVDDNKIFSVFDDENIYYFDKESIDNQQKDIDKPKETLSQNEKIEINKVNEEIKNNNSENENKLSSETEEISKKINDIINSVSSNNNENNNINEKTDKINNNKDDKTKNDKINIENTAESGENKKSNVKHDDFKSIVKKFKEEMEELKFYTFMTEENKNNDLNHDDCKNEQKKMNSIDYMFENNLVMTPFDKQNKDIKWIKINIKELAVFNNDLWRYINNPFFACACKKYKHLILGRQTAENGCTYILGVPGIYSADYKLEAGLQGLKIFKCCEDKIPENNDYGYWIMYINE